MKKNRVAPLTFHHSLSGKNLAIALNRNIHWSQHDRASLFSNQYYRHQDPNCLSTIDKPQTLIGNKSVRAQRDFFLNFILLISPFPHSSNQSDGELSVVAAR
jgi:hypothetical protein